MRERALRKICLAMVVVLCIVLAGCKYYYPDFTEEGAKELYYENTELFRQAAEICAKYQLEGSVYKGELASWDESANTMSEQEKEVFRRCSAKGILWIAYDVWDDDPLTPLVEELVAYVSFDICARTEAYQGIYVFLEDVEEREGGIQELALRNTTYWNVKVEKLDKNVYYYNVWRSDNSSTASEKGH